MIITIVVIVLVVFIVIFLIAAASSRAPRRHSQYDCHGRLNDRYQHSGHHGHHKKQNGCNSQQYGQVPPHSHPIPCTLPPQLELDCVELESDGSTYEVNCGYDTANNYHVSWHQSEDPYHPTTHYTVYSHAGNVSGVGPTMYDHKFDWSRGQGLKFLFAPGNEFPVGPRSFSVTQHNSCGESAPSATYYSTPTII